VRRSMTLLDDDKSIDDDVDDADKTKTRYNFQFC
jgi:hypothetical protein